MCDLSRNSDVYQAWGIFYRVKCEVIYISLLTGFSVNHCTDSLKTQESLTHLQRSQLPHIAYLVFLLFRDYFEVTCRRIGELILGLHLNQLNLFTRGFSATDKNLSWSFMNQSRDRCLRKVQWFVWIFIYKHCWVLAIIINTFRLTK